MSGLAPEEAYHLLAKDPSIHWNLRVISQQARTFFDAAVSFPESSTAPTFPVDVGPVGGHATRVTVWWGPLAPEVVAAAERGVAAIGGAGFDVLVARARSLVQIETRCDGDARAPLVLAGVLASVLLAPIVPPDETTIYGVRGARLRLSARGWPQSAA